MIFLRTSSILLACILSLFAASTATTYAQSIEVSFEQDPLFAVATSSPLMPGDAVMRWFSVANESGEMQTVYVRTVNDDDTNDLADALLVSISDTDGEVYEGQLSDLFSRDNKSDSVSLGDLAAGEMRTYDFSVTFAPVAGNTYQDGTATFDLCVGFAGGNENCITGTGGDSGDDGEDSETGGSGGGSGGSGGGGSDNPDNDNDPAPNGIVAGERTTSLPAQILGAVNDFIRGAARGATTESENESATSTATSSTATGRTESTIAGDAAGAVTTNTSCTFWWLLLLALISLTWSVYDDRLRGSSSSLFSRNITFASVYTVLLILSVLLGVLEAFWWVFAGAWALMTAADYRAHYSEAGWSSTNRNIFFATTGLAFTFSALMFAFPCVWWPFALIAIVSLLLYFFDRG